MKKMTLIIIPMFFLIGCAYTPAYKLNFSSLKSESSTLTKRLTAEQRTEARDKQLDDLSAEYTKALPEAQGRLNTLKGQADRRSGATLGTSLAGIASGITAGVLLVASPANAVWAAAFTGFGTGVLSFQAQMFNEGYSRQTIARIYEDTMNKMAAANEQYETNRHFLVQGKDTLSTDDWNRYLALASGAIIKMHAATIFVPLPIGTPDDLEDLKKNNAELKKLVEDLNAKVLKIPEPKKPE